MGESGKMLSWQPKSSDVSLCALEKQTSASSTLQRLNYILANATPSLVLFIKVESKNSVENFQHLARLLVVRRKLEESPKSGYKRVLWYFPRWRMKITHCQKAYH